LAEALEEEKCVCEREVVLEVEQGIGCSRAALGQKRRSNTAMGYAA
jgi:hypothetical protein